MYIVVFKNDIIKRWLDIFSNLGASGDCPIEHGYLIAPKGENIGSLGVGKKPLALKYLWLSKVQLYPTKSYFLIFSLGEERVR